MGYTQQAFTFNVLEFQEQLLTYRQSKDKLNLIQLQQTVQTSTSSTSNNVALNYMRFNEEWFDNSPEDNMGGLLLLFLAKHLSPSPSISESHQNNFQALNNLLTEFNWSKDEIHQLLYGEKLTTMFTQIVPDYVRLDSKVEGILNSHGGWLSNSRIFELERKLNLISTEIKTENPRIISMIETYLSQGNTKTPTLAVDKVVDSYERAMLMLNSALKRGYDLFLIVD